MVKHLIKLSVYAECKMCVCKTFYGTFCFESQLTIANPLLSGTMISENINHKNDNNMAKQITDDQRSQIYALKKAGHKQNEIALLLRKSPSAISRELARNKTKNNNYTPRIAKLKTKERRIIANKKFKKIENNEALRRYIVRKLKFYWSPEQIAGRWNKDCKEKHIGKDSVYKFVYEKRKDLLKYMRCQKGKYRCKYGKRLIKKQREEQKKRRIDQRPEIINARGRIGDWEGDTIRGQGNSGHLLTNVERKSGYLVSARLDRASMESVTEFTVKYFQHIPKNKRLSITYDNGSEFSGFETVEEQTGMTAYFAFPYHSWERGTNENTNGLMRQFFPKKSRFDNITKERLDEVVKLINNRPRKRLKYLTPHEVFKKNCVLE